MTNLTTMFADFIYFIKKRTAAKSRDFTYVFVVQNILIHNISSLWRDRGKLINSPKSGVKVLTKYIKKFGFR